MDGSTPRWSFRIPIPDTNQLGVFHCQRPKPTAEALKAFNKLKAKREENSLGGVAYMSKDLGMISDPGDVYESAKFGIRSCDLMLSDGLKRIFQARQNQTEKRLAHWKKGSKVRPG